LLTPAVVALNLQTNAGLSRLVSSRLRVLL